MPRKVWLIALSATLALSLASHASACRIYRSPEERVRDPVDGIVIARVESASNTNEYGLDTGASWRGTARRTAGIEGKLDQQTFGFGRSGVCDDGEGVARVGDLWALYLQRRPDGSYIAAYSLPLTAARQIDPRLSGFSPSPMAKPRG